MKPLLLAAIVVAGCNRTDLSADQPDMTVPADMTIARDLAMKATTCGDTIICVIQCGQDPACLPMCLQGANPDTFVQVATLGFCAFQNCLSNNGDAGTPDMFALLGCVARECSSEVSMCDGLPFGPSR